jgi:hypothetical protein
MSLAYFNDYNNINNIINTNDEVYYNFATIYNENIIDVQEEDISRLVIEEHIRFSICMAIIIVLFDALQLIMVRIIELIGTIIT